MSYLDYDIRPDYVNEPRERTRRYQRYTTYASCFIWGAFIVYLITGSTAALITEYVGLAALVVVA